MTAKLIFARADSGRLVHIGEISSGPGSRFTCDECGETLIAKKGKKNQHHFAHQSGHEHEWSYETQLHSYAKQLIVEAGGLAVPLHSAVAAHMGIPELMTYSAHLSAGEPSHRTGGSRLARSGRISCL